MYRPAEPGSDDHRVVAADTIRPVPLRHRLPPELRWIEGDLRRTDRPLSRRRRAAIVCRAGRFGRSGRGASADVATSERGNREDTRCGDPGDPGQVGDPRHRHGGATPGRAPAHDGGVGPVPLRRPLHDRRPAAGHPAVRRWPRGCRHRRRGRSEHARLGGRRPRHPVVPARLRPLPLVRVGHAEPVRPGRQHAHRLSGRRQLPHVHRRPADRPGRRHLDVLRGDASSTSRRASRSTRTCRSTRCACSVAVSAPGGARR